MAYRINAFLPAFATLLLAAPFAAGVAHADERGSFRTRSTLPPQAQPARPSAAPLQPQPLSLDGPLGTVPAYALEMTLSFARQYSSFDIASAATSTSIGAQPTDGAMWTATFVGNDFSKEYLLGDANVLRTISTTDATVTDIGMAAPTVDPDEYWVGMKWDPTTNKVFGVTASHNHGQPGYVYTIDPETAQVTLVAPLDNGSGNFLPLEIAINSKGEIYAVSIVPPYDNYLIKIDKTNGNVDVIGPTGINAAYAQSIDFDKSTDTLYWTAFGAIGAGGAFGGKVFTIDVGSGAVTELGPTPNGGSEVWGMAIAVAAPMPSDTVFCSGFEADDGGSCTAAPANE